MDTKACKNNRILVFAGTFEGHRLAEAFRKRGWQEKADFCVATEYGSELLEDIPGLSVMEGRLSEQDMKRLLREGSYGMVIDATHPYAGEVTKNIRTACRCTGISYVRLLRKSSITEHGSVAEVDSISEAVELLNTHRERVLLTTGAKELGKYSGISGIGERVAARVLPTAESIEACHKAGIPSRHIIAMQGPFSKEMNLATMKQYGCTWLVTKDTGKPGGFDDKMAVLDAGFQIIVIRRPLSEQGDSFEEVMRKAEAFYEK